MHKKKNNKKKEKQEKQTAEEAAADILQSIVTFHRTSGHRMHLQLPKIQNTD